MTLKAKLVKRNAPGTAKVPAKVRAVRKKATPPPATIHGNDLRPGDFVRVVKQGKHSPYISSDCVATTGDVIYVSRRWGADSIQVVRLGNDLTRLQAYTVYEGEYERVDRSTLDNLTDEQVSALTKKLFSKPGTYVGCDPEVFALSSDGSPIPAWCYLPERSSPLKNDGAELGRHGICSPSDVLCFWDGVQAEFTTRAVSCHCFLVDQIRYQLDLIRSTAQKIDPKATLTWKCVVDTPPPLFDGAPEKAKELGCAPSLNAYSDRNHLANINASAIPYRFAGMHLHYSGHPSTLGPEGEQQSVSHNIPARVKALDMIAGVASVSVLAGLEDERRRRYYGLAGEYRETSYGFEWRVLSSAAMCHPVVTHLLLDLARCAFWVNLDHDQGIPPFVWKAAEEEVQHCINNLDVALARAILRRNAGVLQGLMAYHYNTSAAFAMELLTRGAKDTLAIHNESDMAAAWKFGKPWSRHSDAGRATVNCWRLCNK